MYPIYLCMTFLTLSIASISSKTNHSKSKVRVNPAQTVDLNLETTLLFDPKEAKRDLVLIANLRNFLNKIEGVVREKGKNKSKHKKYKNKKYLRTRHAAGNSEVLTDFLTNIGNALQKCKDEEFKNVSKIFKNEVFKLLETYILDPYHISHNVMYKRLFFDPKMKNFIKSNVNEWTVLDTEYLKKKIKNCINNPKNDTITNFVRSLNSLYGKEDKKIFDKIVTILRGFCKNQYDLTSVIRKSLKYIVFDRFDHANFDLKDKMLDYIYELSLYINEDFRYKNPLEGHSHHRRSLINEIFPSLKKSDEDFSYFKDVNNTINSIEKITQDSVQENNEVENEIVINKNLQIDINDDYFHNGTLKNANDHATNNINNVGIDMKKSDDEMLESFNKMLETSDKIMKTSDKMLETTKISKDNAGTTIVFDLEELFLASGHAD